MRPKETRVCFQRWCGVRNQEPQGTVERWSIHRTKEKKINRPGVGWDSGIKHETGDWRSWTSRPGFDFWESNKKVQKMSKKRGPNKSEDEKRGFNFPGGDGLIELVLVYGEQAAYSGAATTLTVFVCQHSRSPSPRSSWRSGNCGCHFPRASLWNSFYLAYNLKWGLGKDTIRWTLLEPPFHDQ